MVTSSGAHYPAMMGASDRCAGARIVALLFLGALATGAAHAQLYKWVDEKGRTHYSEKPPPGQKSQELKVQSTPKPEAAAPAETAKDQPAGKGKKGRPVAQRPVDPLAAEVQRLRGNWATDPGSRVTLTFTVSDVDREYVLIGQQWWIGGQGQIHIPGKYSLAGADGRGTLAALFEPDERQPDIPRKIGYRLEAGALILSVGSGQFAGEHRLMRR